MWDDYHIFLIAPLAFTRLLLDEILSPYRITIWLINDVMLIFVFLLDDLILSFCYSNLSRETGGLELASTITLVLQANYKCTSVQITSVLVTPNPYKIPFVVVWQRGQGSEAYLRALSNKYDRDFSKLHHTCFKASWICLRG